MPYQVLARKWRPRTFGQLVGQEHVVRALSNALDNDRLHHAYLFAGTRGVGKTTLARIFAKSLNCEHGVGSTPCGACAACREIDEGRFVDLLEVDAASRTKVDQTRELLENVPYAPVRGRFKVYLIDEVHMFSDSSFNALLKTLEEPPPHVKFLLATTDPQKVPVTVLSRCLQFNLKRLALEQIQGQLALILETEQIPFEPAALLHLARAADGSMRDALSLLDQSIAYAGGEVREQDVHALLGSAAHDRVYGLLEALIAGDGAALLREVAGAAELAPDFAGLLRELLAVLHRIALEQAAPGVLDQALSDGERLATLARSMSPEDTQLYYQIGVLGQRDLPLAPDPRSGFEMVLLRMLAFRPGAAVGEPDQGAGDGSRTPGRHAEKASAPSARPRSPQTAPEQTAPEQTAPEQAAGGQTAGGQTAGGPAAAEAPAEPQRTGADPSDWDRAIGALRLGGIAAQLAHNCAFEAWDGQRLRLRLDPSRAQLRAASAEERLRKALEAYLGAPVKLDIVCRTLDGETPAQRQARQQADRQSEAEAEIERDPLVDALRDRLDARVVP
ncbi:MAG: DNA polymerase III subunit gamma/tau, partial [Chromatiales bacterium]